VTPPGNVDAHELSISFAPANRQTQAAFRTFPDPATGSRDAWAVGSPLADNWAGGFVMVWSGSFATDRCAMKIASCLQRPESCRVEVTAFVAVPKGQRRQSPWAPARPRQGGLRRCRSIAWAALAFERGFPAVALDVLLQDTSARRLPRIRLDVAARSRRRDQR